MSGFKKTERWFIPAAAMIILFSGCRGRVSEDAVVARVGNVVLDRSAMMKQMVWEGMDQDQERPFVERWVDRQLLYQAAIRQGGSRTDELQFRIDLMEKEYQIQKLLDRIFAEKIKITEADVKQYYEKNKDLFRIQENDVRLFHILTETQQEARMALQQIRTGKSFQDVVEEYSKGMFREAGGDLGYVKRQDLIPALAGPAFRMPENGVSSVIRTDHGYHILKVIKKRKKDDVRDLEDVRDEIMRRIRVNKERMVYYDYLYNLRDKVNVYVAMEAAAANQDSVSVNRP